MAYISVPKDLTKVKTKVALGLTKRQLVCFSAAAAVGLPVYFLTRKSIGGSSAVLLMIAAMLPAFFCAMYERDGLPAEKILRDILRHRLSRRPRPYKTENFYDYITKEEKTLANKENRQARTKKAVCGNLKTAATKRK
ncbi:MAG: PrgI family protein [Oscillospiraceae bacterium]|jgi:hypothetical protein|nr:PrgI family protein [Oscillospiraceae bacterium]